MPADITGAGKHAQRSKAHLWLVPLALMLLAGAGVLLYLALRAEGKPGSAAVAKPVQPDASQPRVQSLEDIDLQALYEKVRRVLRQGSSKEDKNIRSTVVRGMGKLRDEDMFALLAAMLRDDPARSVRSAAALAIAEMGDEGGIEALQEARSRSSEVMKVWIDEALMRLGRPEGRIKLREALRSDDKNVRLQAALALADAGDVAAIPILEEVAAEADRLGQAPPFAILGALASLGHEASLQSLRKALETDQPLPRLGAAEALARLGSTEVVAPLKGLLSEDNKTVHRLIAARILALAGDYSGLDRLKQGVQAEDSETRQVAAAALGSIGDRAALPPLALALEDPKWPVRAAAAESLAALFALMPSALVRRGQDWIQTALANRDWSVRYAAVGATAQMDPELAVNLLGWAFKDTDPRVRAAAVAGLAKVAPGQAMPLLSRAMADPAEQVRREAALVLGRVGTDEAREALDTLVHDKSPTVGTTAAGSMLALGDDRYLKDLARAARAKDPQLRRSAIEAIGRWKSKRALNMLAAALKDRSRRVRFAAAYRLAKRGDRRGIRHLKRAAARGGQDAKRALEALAALGVVPEEEILALARSKSVEDRRQAAASAYLLRPTAALSVLRRSVRATDPRIRRAAVGSLARMAKQVRGTVPLLKTLARDHDVGVRARADVALSVAKKAHSDLSKLDTGKVKPVAQAALPPPPKPKPEPPTRPERKQPLFISPDRPQQQYNYNIARASAEIELGKFGAAARRLRKAQRLNPRSTGIFCEFGYLYFEMAQAALNKDVDRARRQLANAQRAYRRCARQARTPAKKKEAQAGLRDVGRMLHHLD